MNRRIVLTGGGTGGHITPLVAVAHELKLLEPDCHITYIGERNAKYASLTANNPDFDKVVAVYAGKFRRYHGESWATRLTDIGTMLLNIRDLLYFFIGTIQSIYLIKKLNPDVIFLKGGFVGVPVGLAAAFWKKKFITHDSDTVPGLANRLVSKWAALHATGMPEKYYPYPKHATKHVGVLVGRDYVPVTSELQDSYKEDLKLPKNARVLLVTGGSGGAQAINEAVRRILPDLLEKHGDLYVLHQVGIAKKDVYEGYSHERVRVFELLKPMHVYSGASDVVVTRAGANTLAELGVQGRACVVVPNPLLTGGHQLKNADYLKSQDAAVVINEKAMREEPVVLLEAISSLLMNDKRRDQYGKTLQSITIPDAAHKLAQLILNRDT